MRREAEALQSAGHSVRVICLRKSGESAAETVRSVKVERLPIERKRGSATRYIWEYLAFLVSALARVARIHWATRIDVVHVHNMPDVLVLIGLVPRLTGAKVILDLHDPMPEVFQVKYGLSERHAFIRILRFLERVSIRLANRVLTPNVAFREVFVARGCPPAKIQIVMNAPQEDVFPPTGVAPPRHDGKFVIMFHGTVVERHGLGTALEAIRRLRSRVPGLQFEVYGEGDFAPRFEQLVQHHALQDVIRYHGYVSLEEIAEAVQHVDVGLVPNLRNAFTEINLPTRILEYLSAGKPVVAPRTRGILDYFDERSLYLFEPGNAAALADVLYDVYADAGDRAQRLERGLAVYRAHRWERERERLIAVVEELLHGPAHARY